GRIPLLGAKHLTRAHSDICFHCREAAGAALRTLLACACSAKPKGRRLMNRFGPLTALLLVVSPVAAIAMDEHVSLSADQLKWGAAPPAFPKGAQIAVLSGDPSKEGLYVIRLKTPAGYKVAPHSHPFDE